MYSAYITKIKNLHPHSNADRLLCGECFGNQVIVSLDYKEDQLGVYFPVDGQLSVEFAEVNNLLRKKDENGNNIGGYMDPVKRNVTAIKLRGERSDGLFLPLSSLASFGDVAKLKEGDKIDVFNGHEICIKYVPRKNVRTGHSTNGNKTRKHTAPVSPLFHEHADTEQLAYNLGAFKVGDEIEITLKMHGTSQRTAYLPVLKKYKRSLIDRILRREGKPVYDWGYVSGTRRTVLNNYDGGFYGSNAFREKHSKTFEGKLWKGESVYYEVVGFIDNGTPIMGTCSNKKLNDEEFIKQYGKETIFSYGCVPIVNNDNEEVQSDIYVYRMTMTNEDGDVVEYSPDFMRYRCEQMGVKTVPVFTKFILHDYDLELDDREPGEIVKDIAERYYDGPDPIGKTHVREGVVVRIVNKPKFTAYKHKNWYFKALSGIISDNVNTDKVSEEILSEM